MAERLLESGEVGLPCPRAPHVVVTSDMSRAPACAMARASPWSPDYAFRAAPVK